MTSLYHQIVRDILSSRFGISDADHVVDIADAIKTHSGWHLEVENALVKGVTTRGVLLILSRLEQRRASDPELFHSPTDADLETIRKARPVKITTDFTPIASMSATAKRREYHARVIAAREHAAKLKNEARIAASKVAREKTPKRKWFATLLGR